MAKDPGPPHQEKRARALERIEDARWRRSTTLDLSDLGLKALPEAIGKLTQLRDLDVSDNQLIALPDAIGRLSQLTTLDVSRNQLTALPDAIGKLANLATLVVFNNQLTALPDAIGKLNQLKILDVSDNQLTALPDTIGKLIRLTDLDVSNNQLTALPDAIGKLNQLTNLDVSENRLTALPDAIGKLTQLASLNATGNNLTALPDAIGKLTQLANLNVTGNKLTLPDAIGKLTQLTALVVSHNQMTDLPEAVGNLTQLTQLGLDNNRLTSLPDAISQLGQLTALVVSDNKMTALPEAIGKLTQLTMLGISGNQLTTLPDAIGKLTRLSKLFVPGNQLITLPDAIGKLAGLTTLDVSRNQLTALPETLGQLTRLTTLNVSGNQMTALPESLRALSFLKRLFLHGNNSLGLPAEVLGPTVVDVYGEKATPAKPADILDYYFRTRGGARPLNEAKLILVGFGKVGKTSLVNRLVDDTFDPDEAKTEGIRITQWPIQLQSAEDVRLHVWDFGGQEIMHSTHQFFLTQRSLYLLVLNGRQGHEDADAEYWLSLIDSFAADSPVIVVLNKIREHPFTVNRRGLIQKFPNIRDFIETDCDDRTGIDVLDQLIRRETDRLPNLRDAFPASWFSIKDRLAAMSENYLTFEQFRRICVDNGETEDEAQDKLAFYLHSLGVALNYKDDPRLRDTHVLNPEWVTNGIYRILNADVLAARKGELQLSDLADILDRKDYPTERHGFLLELMRKFELCFRFPEERDDRYLIPDLLDKEQPEVAEDFRPEDCLNFEYHYPVLPEGLLPRFIVRTYVLSTGQPRWRSGVILDFEGNRALVDGDGLAKRVRMAVAGPVDARRRLLAVIRNDFETIHRSYKFKPAEMVPVPGHPDLRAPYGDLLVMEREGETTFTTVSGGQVVKVNVTELLNGVDLEGARRLEPAAKEPRRAVRLFYSYAHKDEELRDELETHLKLFQRQGLIEPWHDRGIGAGTEWAGEIDDNLDRADVVLLLVSADFIASDYCYDKEMTRALERHEQGAARVIPIVIRDCNWQSAPFGKLQALPTDSRPVTTWGSEKYARDTAWKNVADGIEAVIKELLETAHRERAGR
jgi:internalin A